MAPDRTRRTRRRFLQGSLALAGLGLLAGCGSPFTPPAQPARVHRIGYLATAAPTPVTVPSFRQGLRDLGYVEGENLLLEERYASGDDQFAELAAELVRLRLEVIAVASNSVAGAVRTATAAIPIVSIGAGDLVSAGLVDSLGRPGGNVTGLSTPFLGGKLLQLLQETVPTLSRVVVLFDATIPTLQREPYEAAARSLGLQLQFVGAARFEDLGPVFETAVREHADGILILNNPLFAANQTRISELAVQRRLPSMWGQTDAVGRGGLIAYGPNRADLARRAATYVDKILNGAQPADLPVEQPTKFDFVVNMKTAQALGLTIPPSVLAQATEFIQ